MDSRHEAPQRSPERADSRRPPATGWDARREAERRLRQQQAVAALGLEALVTMDLQEVLDAVSATAAETLRVPFVAILELVPGETTALLRAGRGWREGLVGSVRVPAGKRSAAGQALAADEPLVIEDLRRERRFRPPRLLTDHGVVGSLAVVIQSRSGPWGILGIHSDRSWSFSPDDVHFAQSLANLVTAAVERQRMEIELDRSRTELALHAAESRLHRSDRLASLGTLAAGLAHEINNPVSTILMTAESARMEVDERGLDGRLAGDLDVIMDNAERCGAIVHRVLDFVGEHRAEMTVEDINEIVRSAARLARTTIGADGSREHRLTFDLAADLPRLQVGRGDLEQALVHLIGNAFEAADAPVRVTVSTRATGRGVEIVVQDDGPGIPAEDRARIFNPFFTTHRERGGTGLGLPLAHRLVADHGGTLDLDCRSGDGATFRIGLPADPPTDPSTNGQRG